MVGVPPPDIVLKRLDRPGVYLKVRLRFVKLPFTHPPRHVPALLLSMVRRIVEPLGWRLYYSDVIMPQGSRTGEFIVVFKATGTAIPYALLGLVGAVVAGVVIFYIYAKIVEVKEQEEIVRWEKEKIATARDLYEKCIEAGGTPGECSRMVTTVGTPVEVGTTEEGGTLGELKSLLITAIGGLILLEILRRR